MTTQLQLAPTEPRGTEVSPAPRGRHLGDALVRRTRAFTPLLWLAPALVLILSVVVWPALEMVRTSLQRISSTGLVLGPAGLRNYTDLLAEPDLVGVLVRTAAWVIGVVGVTVLVSLALAQLLHQQFPGRRVVRWALIVPWAASVVMTAVIWKWMLNNFYGVVNRVLLDLGVLSRPVDWLGEPGTAFACLIAVAVFVSLPFTTYALLAGLATVPGEVYEAAKIDGASAWRTYRAITLPLLRPALTVATVINVINVFNSFPIIWAMTQGGPGHDTDTTTTFMYKIAFLDQNVGESAAMAVLNFLLILGVVLLYLRLVWREE